MSIKDALLLKNIVIEYQEEKFTFRRPSAADMIAAVEKAKSDDFVPWLVLNHLLSEDGQPFFITIEEVLQSDGRTIFFLASEIDKLYGEGGN